MLEEHRLHPDVVLKLLATIDDMERKPETVKCLVLTGTGKFWSNGFDLKYMQAYPEHMNDLQKSVELLISKVLRSPLVTVAACNGHAVAAGAMLMLAFDYIVFNADRGFCFVPGIDLGLVYSPGMTELMKAKLPNTLWRDFITFGQRFDGPSLLRAGVVHSVCAPGEVLSNAQALAKSLLPKTKHPATLAAIKTHLYHEAISALECEVDEMVHNPEFEPMGFDVVPRGKDKPAGGAATDTSSASASGEDKSGATPTNATTLPAAVDRLRSGSMMHPAPRERSARADDMETRKNRIISVTAEQSLSDLKRVVQGREGK